MKSVGLLQGCVKVMVVPVRRIIFSCWVGRWNCCISLASPSRLWIESTLICHARGFLYNDTESFLWVRGIRSYGPAVDLQLVACLLLQFTSPRLGIESTLIWLSRGCESVEVKRWKVKKFWVKFVWLGNKKSVVVVTTDQIKNVKYFYDQCPCLPMRVSIAYSDTGPCAYWH